MDEGRKQGRKKGGGGGREKVRKEGRKIRNKARIVVKKV